MRIVVPALVAVATAILIVAGLYFLRLRTIGSRVGSFECALKHEGAWVAGVATYTVDHLDWYEVVSLSARPKRRFVRRELEVSGRHRRELVSGTSQVSEARCRYRGEEFLLAANDQALDGLVSWLEASPPGPHASRLL